MLTRSTHFFIYAFAVALSGCGARIQLGSTGSASVGSSGAVASVCPSITAVSVTPSYSTNGINWNDYVENTAATFYGATDSACNGDGVIDGGARNTEFAGAAACLHGGEHRRVNVPSETSCSSLSISDSLGAFNWRCVDSGANVVFHSIGLKEDKRLSDLLTALGTGWRSNSVTITKSGTNCYQSASTAWWTNPVVNINGLDNATVGGPGLTGVAGVHGVDNTGAYGAAVHMYRADDASTIYTVTADKNLVGFSFNADKQGLVIYPGVTLTHTDPGVVNCTLTGAVGATSDAKCLIGLGSKWHHWIEGHFDSAAISRNITGTAKFSRFRKLDLRQSVNSRDLLYTNDVDFSRFYDIRLSHSESDGLWITGSNYNVFWKIYGTHIGGNPFVFAGNSTDNVLVQGLFANNGAYGFQNNSQSRNTVSHMTTVNNGGGIGSFSGDNNNFTQILAANNGVHGLLLDDTDFSKLAQIVSTNNANYGVYMDATSDTNIFSGDLLAGANGTNNCFSDALNAGNNIDDGATVCTEADVNLTVTTGKTLLASFAGQVVDDSDNADTGSLNGSGYLAYASVTDWFNFENWFRGWGKGLSQSALDALNTGSNPFGLNAMWDWRISSSDTQLRNFNGAFVSGAACPASVHGDISIADQIALLPNTYLLNATETIDDGYGDDDGLCESNEYCIYSPNIGAYQGEGSLGTCTFDDAGGLTNVSGVIMSGYLTNGP